MEQIPSSPGEVFQRPSRRSEAVETLARLDAQLTMLIWSIKGTDPRASAILAARWAEVDKLLDRRFVLQAR